MSYLPYEPQQQMLLPEALQDRLPEGHLAYFVSDAVDGLDLSAFHALYANGGSRNQPFHPAMMVEVVFSSRKIAKKLHEDVALRVLDAGNFPRASDASDFQGFRHMLKAEAKLKAQIAALLSRAKSADDAEKNEPDLDIPAEIARRQDRLTVIAQARGRLEQRQREAEIERGRDPDDKPRGGRYERELGVPEDKAQDNFADPDSRIMKRAGGGFDPSYNAQTAVDEAAHIIVAAELTHCGSDAGELPVMLQAVEPETDGHADRQLSDLERLR